MEEAMGQFDSLWEEFFSMQREMQRFVEHLAGKRPSFTPFAEEPWVPACDVFETDVAFFVVVELAGVDPKEIEIFIQGKKLVVRGERREIPSPPKRDYYLMEIHFGPFYREIEFEEDIEDTAVRARYRNGFLVIECPKKHVWERRVPIDEGA
uniref:Hsp20/alpha crystallin family protein n=1 Tax=Candidatus Caldatribacterium californiense TaxID=1454726 RepID=A0A7V4DH82_9BACT